MKISCLFEGLSNILEEIFAVFDAAGDSDEVVLDSKELSLLRGNREVSHEGGIFNQTLNTTEALSECEDLNCSQEAFSSIDVSLDIEGDHGTRATSLLLAKVILRVRLEAGINNAVNLRVLLKERSNLLGVLHRTFNTDS